MNNKNNIINQNENKICSAHIKIQDEYNKLLHEYKEVILDQKISVAKKQTTIIINMWTMAKKTTMITNHPLNSIQI